MSTSFSPIKGYHYWLYDLHGGGMVFYDSERERDADAKAVIAKYNEEGWHDVAECVCAGVITVTHSAERMGDDYAMMPFAGVQAQRDSND